MSDLHIIVLAAGKGTRMHSQLPKVLQPLAGKALLAHVLGAAEPLNPASLTVVYGHGGALVRAQFADRANIVWAEQKEQLGTGHAVKMALSTLPQTGKSVILYGDVPLIQPTTLQQLLQCSTQGLSMITLVLDDPTGYGRIVRDADEKISHIVEHKDASDLERRIQEVNTGVYAVDNALLHRWIPQLSNHNAQGEYYLTDIVRMATDEGIVVGSIQPENSFEVDGVNDRVQLATLERAYQHYRAVQYMKQGLMLMDPQRFDVRGTLHFGQDVCIDANVVIEGECQLGNHVHIGVGCILKNCTIGDHCHIAPYSVIEQAVIAAHCHVGPFARLRPGTQLDEEAHIGNFVEVKNSHIGQGSKANHLTYIGDATIGQQCNIGAGTITCNYDGANKHRTVLGDRVFVGSNSALVAPLHIADGATVGAGSVITKPVQANELVLERNAQRHIANYKRPTKK